MLRKLKVKFLIASVLALSIVIAIMIGTINFLNYRSVMNRADEILDFIMEHDGKFPDIKLDLPLPEDFITAETPYESRFFTVTYSSSGDIYSVNTTHIAAIDDEEAVKMANTVTKMKKDRGMLGNYRYLSNSDDGSAQVIFLDCTKSLENFSIFLALSIMLSFIGVFAVSVFLFMISDRILKPISESYEKQRRFIADAGHDIKTPLTIIDADAELLELEIGNNEWLSDIKKQTDRLSSLTTELIYLSKIEGLKKAKYTFFPISDAIEEIVQSFSAPAKTKDITLNAEISAGLYHKGDETAIKKLINILLDNAIKYSPDKSEISVVLKHIKGGISLRVRNYARELSDEAITHIFERFYRSDSARSSAGGFGIGLSVAQAIVTSHKGKISAEKDGDFLVIEILL